MRHGTISTLVTNSVALGGGVYGARLTISASGTVAPSATGADGITATASLAGVRLWNDGDVGGGTGAAPGQTGGQGGDGINLAAAALVNNTGLVTGGSGGYGVHSGGQGGSGLVLSGGGHLSNTGAIAGGLGHSTYQYYGSIAGQGGAGVVAVSGTIIANGGQITGGGGGSALVGSDGGGYGTSGNGGVGVELGGTAFLANHGDITGGAGGYYAPFGKDGFYYGGGGAGGAGVSLAGGGSLINTGHITGGASGASEYYDRNAGAGVAVYHGGVVINHGLITGGASGGSNYYDGTAAAGGIGVDLANGGTLTNTGTILGGAGGYEVFGSGGTGGTGVFISGGTLVDSGTIIGGAGGAGYHVTGVQGDAVQFGYTAGTLVVDPSAVFLGSIVANEGTDDVLVLAGTTPGTLAGIGTSVTGFSNIIEEANAHWKLTGGVYGAGTLTISSGATMILQGAVSLASIAFGAGGGEALVLNTLLDTTNVIAGFGAGDVINLLDVQAKSLTFQHGTLTLFDAGHMVVDTLVLSGHYNAADFKLVTQGHNTEILYNAQASDWHAPVLWMAHAGAEGFVPR